MNLFLKFLAAGSIHTTLDFVIFNLLISKLAFRRLEANLISTTFALILNFLVNYFLVFQAPLSRVYVRALEHLMVTLFSSFGIQNLVLMYGGRPLRECMRIFPFGNLAHLTHGEPFERNILKATGVGLGLCWNFLWYKYLVFTS